jgi:putative FmdB family regulatory protein
MPIYAYRCSNCGHAKDVLQKMSDPVLSVCPACGEATFVKQLTAAGFQLKGSGWYVTDFRGDNNKPGAKPAEGEAGKTAGDGDATKADAGATTPAAPGAAPAAAPAPSPSVSPSKSDKPAASPPAPAAGSK